MSEGKQTAKHLFVWRGGGRTVQLTGDFTEWNQGLPMEKKADGHFELELEIPVGEKVFFKYIVDGRNWQYDSTLPWQHDQFGNINNVVCVDCERPPEEASAPTAVGPRSLGAHGIDSTTRAALRRLHNAREWATAPEIEAAMRLLRRQHRDRLAAAGVPHATPSSPAATPVATASGSEGEEDVEAIGVAAEEEGEGRLVGAPDYTAADQPSLARQRSPSEEADHALAVDLLSEHVARLTQAGYDRGVAASMALQAMELQIDFETPGIVGDLADIVREFDLLSTDAKRAGGQAPTDLAAAGAEAGPAGASAGEAMGPTPSAGKPTGGCGMRRVVSDGDVPARARAASNGSDDGNWLLKGGVVDWLSQQHGAGGYLPWDPDSRPLAPVGLMEPPEAADDVGDCVPGLDIDAVESPAPAEAPSIATPPRSPGIGPAGVSVAAAAAYVPELPTGGGVPQASSAPRKPKKRFVITPQGAQLVVEGPAAGSTPRLAAGTPVPAATAAAVRAEAVEDANDAADGGNGYAGAMSSPRLGGWGVKAPGLLAGAPALPAPPVPPAAAAAGGSVAAAATRTSGELSVTRATVRREGKLVLALVGLPARGKTYVARKLTRHLTWMGLRTEIFNVGNYRRKLLKGKQPSNFFDPNNKEGMQLRHRMAEAAFDDMCDQLERPGGIDIAVFDATNSTKSRRAWLTDSLQGRFGNRCKVVFIESVCKDERTLSTNIRETKLRSPDYKNMPQDKAVTDFLRRIAHYVTVYEPLDDDEAASYVKLIDVGNKIVAHQMSGYLNSRILYFLSNLHITPRPIWLTRHGESKFNVTGRIGGDPGLSQTGELYALKLAAFMKRAYPAGEQLTVWTSTLKRTRLTARHIGRSSVQWRNLDEIDAGVCDGMTYEGIAKAMPQEYAARSKDKFHYRYPRGESYQDIVQRLEPVIIELMRQKGPVLIVSHQATLRVLYSYLCDKSPDECPRLLMPLHTVIQITPQAYGVEEVRHKLMSKKPSS